MCVCVCFSYIAERKVGRKEEKRWEDLSDRTALVSRGKTRADEGDSASD